MQYFDLNFGRASYASRRAINSGARGLTHDSRHRTRRLASGRDNSVSVAGQKPRKAGACLAHMGLLFLGAVAGTNT
jgi:hypothetical protein